ncbi:cereblon [Paragonimus westermani]|uniref:Cereblon n=1 Tax=Paragonimus westermani TaxID=34504 RepID=A0A5J4NP11_9TREM|nr:cereblon [Paragonimus westermani]
MWDGGSDAVENVSRVLLGVGENESAVIDSEGICESDINFDRALPGLHKYLGDDFVEVGGRTIFEPGTEARMFAFYRSGVILVPGQSLPLIAYGPYESKLLRRVNREKLPLIFLPGCLDHLSALDDLIGFVGTSADLMAIRFPDDEEDHTTHAIFVGRQRFLIKKMTRDESYPLVCHGTILPELSVNREMASHPLGWGLIPRSWSRFGTDPIAIRSKQPEMDPVLPASDHSRSSRAKPARRRSRHSQDSTSASSTSSSSPSASYHSATCVLPPGNPLSIFDSRLSTWRYFGPVSSGSASTFSSVPSSNSRLDHFVDDTPIQTARGLHATNTPDVTSVAIGSTEHGADDDGAIAVLSAVLCQPTCTNTTDTAAVTSSQHTIPQPTEPRIDELTEDVELIMDRAVDRVGRPFRYRIRQPCHPRLLARRDVLAAVAESFVPLPVWVYRQYDVSTACVCVGCDANITSNRDIICLAQEGSFQTYVNPAGVLHDMVTVSQVAQDAIMLVGSASEEYSWFPGYSWTIANCANCSQHLGWLFNAVKSDLLPRRFWGIRREAIVPGLINSTDWHPCV